MPFVTVPGFSNGSSVSPRGDDDPQANAPVREILIGADVSKKIHRLMEKVSGLSGVEKVIAILNQTF